MELTDIPGYAQALEAATEHAYASYDSWWASNLATESVDLAAPILLNAFRAMVREELWRRRDEWGSEEHGRAAQLVSRIMGCDGDCIRRDPTRPCDPCETARQEEGHHD